MAVKPLPSSSMFYDRSLCLFVPPFPVSLPPPSLSRDRLVLRTGMHVSGLGRCLVTSRLVHRAGGDCLTFDLVEPSAARGSYSVTLPMPQCVLAAAGSGDTATDDGLRALALAVCRHLVFKGSELHVLA